MKTVELSAALGQAQVVENLKNFVGVDAQGAAALMTPERLAAVAGGLGKYPKMQQGALIGNDIKNIPDGCCYSYGGETADGSLITGPTLSVSANEKCTLQIKAEVSGARLMFRVRHIQSGNWSNWKEIAIKQ